MDNGSGTVGGVSGLVFVDVWREKGGGGFARGMAQQLNDNRLVDTKISIIINTGFSLVEAMRLGWGRGFRLGNIYELNGFAGKSLLD